jgi:hypothetical protein
MLACGQQQAFPFADQESVTLSVHINPWGMAMSVPEDLSKLVDVMGRYRFDYLLMASERGATHAVAVTAVSEGGELVVDQTGRRSRDNTQQRPDVALIWPPQSESDYSLIVDGQALVAGAGLRIAPRRAVLHRPAPSLQAAAPGTCGSDCVKVV